MLKKLPGFAVYLIAAGLLCIGLGIVYYAFELVGVPHAREYSEGVYVIIGSILAVCGAGWGVYHYRATRQTVVEP